MRPDVRILAIVCCAKPTLAAHVQELITQRVDQVLDAQASPVEIFAALTDEAAAGSVVQVRLREHYQRVASGMHLLSRMDERERRLLHLVARGRSNDSIAVELGVSARTIRARLERVRPLLGVSSREELAAWAGAHGLYWSPAASSSGQPAA